MASEIGHCDGERARNDDNHPILATVADGRQYSTAPCTTSPSCTGLLAAGGNVSALQVSVITSLFNTLYGLHT